MGVKFKMLVGGIAVLLLIVGISTYTVLHESAHEKINLYIDGCVSTIEYRFLGLGGVTTSYCNTSHEAALLHAQNEIIGYNLFPIFLALMCIMVFLMVIMFKV